MFIKVTDGLVVNTEHVSLIVLNQNVGEIFFSSELGLNERNSISVPIATAHYLLALVEANTALTNIEAAPATLTSRVAQTLRDNYPNGATAPMLAIECAVELGDVIKAIVILNEERVIKGNAHGGGGYTLWYHATNAPKEVPFTFDFNARGEIYTWECSGHTPTHVQTVTVTSPGFQAGILYCNLCTKAHQVPNDILALYSAPTVEPKPTIWHYSAPNEEGGFRCGAPIPNNYSVNPRLVNCPGCLALMPNLDPSHVDASQK